MQSVTPYLGTAFQPIDDTLCSVFLRDLSKGDTSQIPGRVVTSLPVKKVGIALPDPTQTFRANWTASCFVTEHLTAVLCGTAEFWSGDYALFRGEGRDEIRRRHAEDAETELGEARADTSMEDACRMGWITRAGAWLSVFPSTVNGMDLGAQEWRDSLYLSYGINIPHLLEHCYRCGAAFDICHTLDCKKVGLITARHNDIRYGVSDLASKAFTPTHVRGDPKI